MRADRLLSILLMMQQGRRLTARELAEKLEVSQRTILRDLEALAMSGVPVVSLRGAGGGWSLSENYRTNLTGLTADEVRTLLFAKPNRLMEDLGLGQAANSAAIKLSASLSPRSRQDVDFMHRRLHIDGAGWYQSNEKFPNLQALQEAVWQDRQMRISYRSSDGASSERVVNPLGLVAKGSVWYVIASHDEGIRSYRVSRVESVELLDSPSCRPDNFDLPKYWKQNVVSFKAGVPRYVVKLHATEAVVTRIQLSKFVQIESTGAPDDNGWTDMTLRFDDPGEAHDFVVRLADGAIVLEPEELRRRLCATAKALMRAYNEYAPPNGNDGH